MKALYFMEIVLARVRVLCACLHYFAHRMHAVLLLHASTECEVSRTARSPGLMSHTDITMIGSMNSGMSINGTSTLNAVRQWILYACFRDVF
jgi:hypothetical protein